MKSLLSIVLAFVALPLAAAYASRDLVLPIAGNAHGGDGRLYLTALWITNPSARDALDVTLTFHPANEKLPAHASPVHLAAGETRLIDPVDAAITGQAEALGYLRIRSTGNVLATARLYSRFANESNARSSSTSWAAVPAQFAIGSGDSATLQGIGPAMRRVKIYFAEVDGKPLEVRVALVDLHGKQLAQKQMYIDKERHITADAAELFPNLPVGPATLRVDGVHGAGRVIVAGSATSAESGDALPLEMSFTTTPRNRIGIVEALTYACVAAAAFVALVVRR